MAPAGADDGSLHTGNAAAYHRNGLGLGGRLNLVLSGLHGLGIDGTPGHAPGVKEGLGVGVALVVSQVEAAVVAADTGADFRQPIFHQLGNPLSVCQELPGNAYGINPPLGNGFRTHIRLHPSGTYHGNVHKLLDVGHIL